MISWVEKMRTQPPARSGALPNPQRLTGSDEEERHICGSQKWTRKTGPFAKVAPT